MPRFFASLLALALVLGGAGPASAARPADRGPDFLGNFPAAGSGENLPADFLPAAETGAAVEVAGLADIRAALAAKLREYRARRDAARGKRALTPDRIRHDAEGRPFADGEVIVKYSPGIAKKDREIWQKNLGLRERRRTTSSAAEAATRLGFRQVSLEEDFAEVEAVAAGKKTARSLAPAEKTARAKKVETKLAALRGAKIPRAAAKKYAPGIVPPGEILYAEPNFIAEVENFSTKILPTAGAADGALPWFLTQISAPAAWEKTRGDPSIVVAVVDTGLDGDALADFAGSAGKILPGFDFVDDDADPADAHGHGTLVASVVAAVCPDCAIMPVRVMDANGLGTYADIAAGIVWAADHGAKVINLSLGGPAYSEALREAVDYAKNQGAVVVSVAGNDGAAQPTFPAGYDSVIAVGATTETDEKLPASNFGDFVDLVAPGENIPGANFPDGGTALADGTSSAAAIVSGAAGLLRASRTDLDPDGVRVRILGNAVDLGAPGRDDFFGNGRLDAGRMFASAGEVIYGEAVGPERGVNFFPTTGKIGQAYVSYLGNRMWQIPGILEQYPGPLKNYREGEYQRSVMDEINDFIGPSLDEAIIPILEIKAGLVSNPGAQVNANIFDIDEDRYVKFYHADYDNWGYAGQTPFDEKRAHQKFQGTDLTSLSTQIWFLSHLTGEAQDRFYNDKTFLLPGGSKLPAPAEMNYDTFRVWQVLAYLADSPKQWEEWTSWTNPNSFQNIWIRLFGYPAATVQSVSAGWLPSLGSSQTTPVDPPAPFLERLPFDGAQPQITALFDHASPKFYAGGYTNDANIFTRFTGESVSNPGVSTCDRGISCYDRHEGVDFAVGSAIYAPANGFVDKVVGVLDPTAIGAGNYVILKHDLDDLDATELGDEQRFDISSVYYHLRDKSNLVPGQFIHKGDLIGYAGDTGAPGAVHLHFGLQDRRYKTQLGANGQAVAFGINDSFFLDPLGWWGDTPDPWLVATDGLAQSGWSFASSTTVRPGDPSFFRFFAGANSPANDWGIISQTGSRWATAESYGPDDPKWQNWTFAAADLPVAGTYRVEARIPDAPPAGQTATTDAHYRIFAKKSATGTADHFDQIVDQAAALGKWAALGDFEFEKGPSAAVRLVDEAGDPGAAVLADSVRWTLLSTAPATSATAPILTVPDASVTLREKPSRLGIGHSYRLDFTVRNDGTEPVAEAQACVVSSIFSFRNCSDGSALAGLTPGAEAAVRLDFWTAADLATAGGDLLGRISIRTPDFADLSGADLRTAQIAAGGAAVDFSSAGFAGLETDPITGQLEFVIRGKETGLGETPIDLDGERTGLTKIFLQSLVIPDASQKVALEIQQNQFGEDVGRAVVPDLWKNTDAATAMLEADIALKKSLFGNEADIFVDGKSWDAADGVSRVDPSDRHRFDFWNTLVDASPYFAELSAANFKAYPRWVAKAVIRPGAIAARAEGERIFLDEPQLAVELDFSSPPTLDLAGYPSLSADARADLDARLAAFRGVMEDFFQKYTDEILLPRVNSPDADPEFLRLRAIYGAVSAAQWYKARLAERAGVSDFSLPYAGYRDAQTLAGLGIQADQPWDQSYWDSQAYQVLASLPCDLRQNAGATAAGTCYFWGGIDGSAAEPAVSGGLTPSDAGILGTALGELGTVSAGDAQYFFGGEIRAAAPDLTVTDLRPVADRLIAGGIATIAVDLANLGAATPAFSVTLLIKNLRTGVETPIGSRRIFLTEGETRTENFTWTLPADAGDVRLVARVDAADETTETLETNNSRERDLRVLPFDPTAVAILSPAAGAVFDVDETGVFSVRALDPETGSDPIPDEEIFWLSDRDGPLGTGAQLSAENLSVGPHLLTAEAADGRSDLVAILVEDPAARTGSEPLDLAAGERAGLAPTGALRLADPAGTGAWISPELPDRRWSFVRLTVGGAAPPSEPPIAPTPLEASAGSGFFYGEIAGNFSLDPGTGGVAIADGRLVGELWGEAAGWISFGSGTAADLRAAETADGDFGLDGCGWGEAAGWVCFGPNWTGAPAGLATDGDRVIFSGFAWSENLGWLALAADPLPRAGFIAAPQIAAVIVPQPRLIRAAAQGFFFAESAGFLALAPAGGELAVDGDRFVGEIWGDGIGWVRFGSGTAADLRLIDDGSVFDLDGCGWGETAGWLCFGENWTGEPAFLDARDGPAKFVGFAWSENLGWVSLAGDSEAPAGVAVTAEPLPGGDFPTGVWLRRGGERIWLGSFGSTAGQTWLAIPSGSGAARIEVDLAVGETAEISAVEAFFVRAPRIGIFDENGAPIDPGATVDFGTLEGTATPPEKIFTLKNLGDAGLFLPGDPPATIDPPGDFAVVSAPGIFLEPGGETAVRLRFDPPTDGGKTAFFHLPSTDPATPDLTLRLEGAGGDRAAPTVAATDPLPGENFVAVGAEPGVTFSENMDENSLRAGALTLSLGGAPVPGVVSAIGSGAKFIPAGELRSSATYAARVGTTALDLAGNALAAPVSWTFTTEDRLARDVLARYPLGTDLIDAVSGFPAAGGNIFSDGAHYGPVTTPNFPKYREKATFSVWAKLPSSAGPQSLIFFGDLGDAHSGIRFEGGKDFSCNAATAGRKVSFSLPDDFPLGSELNNFAMTWDGSTGELACFVNGAEMARGTFAPMKMYSYGDRGAIGQAFRMDFTSGSQSPEQISTGWFSDARVYDDALSPTAVAQLAESRAVSFGKNQIEAWLFELGQIAKMERGNIDFSEGSFGDGSDGDRIVTGRETLDRDFYFENLTVATGATLETGGFMIFVKNTFKNFGTVKNNGGDGGGGLDADRAAPYDGGYGGRWLPVEQTNGGDGGAGGFFQSAPAGGHGGKAGAPGVLDAGDGGDGRSGWVNLLHSTGLSGGSGGNGGGPIYCGVSCSYPGVGGAGGSEGDSFLGTTEAGIRRYPQYHSLSWDGARFFSMPGNGGGAGGGGGSQQNNWYGAARGDGGGGGGGSGGNGGLIVLAHETLENLGQILVPGGSGGSGGGISYFQNLAPIGGAGGGAGGNGGTIGIIARHLKNFGLIEARGGAGGRGGDGSLSPARTYSQEYRDGLPGEPGPAGLPGQVIEINL